MGSVNDNIQAALSPIYGAKSTNHLIQLFREDHGLLENDRWQAYLQGTPLSDITGLSPVGSLQDIERLLFENFAELHNESTGLRIAAVAADYITTPDTTDLDITGDICLIFRGTIYTATTSNPAPLIYKAGVSSAAQGSYMFMVTGTAGQVNISDGTTLTVQNSTADFIVNGVSYWYAITVDLDDGTSCLIKFWRKLDDLTSDWEMYYSATKPTISSIRAGTELVQVGGRYAGTLTIDGLVKQVQIYDGIGDNSAPGLGTLVAEFDASAPVGPRYRDRTGKIWTINGSAWSWE